MTQGACLIWTEFDEDDLAAELGFVQRDIYLHELELAVRMLTAFEPSGVVSTLRTSLAAFQGGDAAR